LTGAGDCAQTGDKQKAAASETKARREMNNDRILKIEPNELGKSKSGRSVTALFAPTFDG
jgi:hypothetical protein